MKILGFHFAAGATVLLLLARWMQVSHGNPEGWTLSYWWCFSPMIIWALVWLLIIRLVIGFFHSIFWEIRK